MARDATKGRRLAGTSLRQACAEHLVDHSETQLSAISAEHVELRASLALVLCRRGAMFKRAQEARRACLAVHDLQRGRSAVLQFSSLLGARARGALR
eukprot:6204044-Pleurochrysis_carterae.AAC.1